MIATARRVSRSSLPFVLTNIVLPPISVAASLPTGLIPRFSLFIEVMKQEMSRSIDWRWRRGTLGSLGLVAGTL